LSTSSEAGSTQDQPSVTRGIFRRAGQILIMFIILGLELFLGSGHLDWKAAWVYLGISLLSVAVNAVFMLRNSPETVAERGQPKQVERWDRWIGGLLMICQYIFIPLVAALDYRYGWSGAYPVGWQVLAAFLYALSLGLTGWAMISNAYFSTAVRIQADRGQQVCRSGPYRYVRHPGYVGFCLQALSVPILLGSFWALLFTLPVWVLIVIRTSLEDRMLQEQLQGYQEYAREVRYRLIPRIW
jgi:protein-S-isoprenylcysteine O-methyltransferase Ste14